MGGEVGAGGGPAERAPDAGGGGATAARRPRPRRVPAGRKREAVPRLPRDEGLESASRELGMAPAALGGRREACPAAGAASPESRPADARDAGIGRPKGKVGELTVGNGLLGAGIEH